MSSSANKTNSGNFLEDFTISLRINHATPRTLTDGDRTLYTALYPTRFALPSSDAFAVRCGLPRSPIEELAAFHVAFGKTVPDVSLNAVANLGYAELQFHRPIYPGDTLATESEVIGVKENSNGKTGVVWVRSTARLVEGDGSVPGPVAIDWVRWVMVKKRDPSAPAPQAVVPELSATVPPDALYVPAGLTFEEYDFTSAGEPHRWGDYEIGEKIDHVDGVTIEEAEHMLATRLWQNTAKVHFNAQAREDGKRLIYGGHVISLARALSFNGLANTQLIAAINAGSHANPCFAGDTVYAWSEVLDKAETGKPSVGALRLRLVAVKNAPAADFRAKGEDGKYLGDVLLDLDYWALTPM
ncbi:MAG: MaoC family dehydratase [Rhodobacteraceae bacterium]|nr:MaoC family dehydratase [Paracoccaceae bacterium]